jgi:ribosome-binding factor A
VRLRFIPELQFEFDRRIDKGMNVIELLDEVSEGRKAEETKTD